MMDKGTSLLLLCLALLAVVRGGGDLHHRLESGKSTSQPAPICHFSNTACNMAAYGQDDFNLEDAFDDVPTKKPKPAPKPPKFPVHGSDDFDLADYFDATQPPKVIPKPPPKKPDVFVPTTRKPRITTNKPPKKKDPPGFDLADALDENNDRPVGGGGGGGFSDSDLEDIYNDGYRPDKGKGGGVGGRGSAGNAGEGDNTGNVGQTETIAGVAGALAMALIGAVTSYISYQQKKFCFSIQQGLNAEYVKGEHMEGVVSEEPQVKYSALESQSAVPPTGDPSKV